MFSLTNVIIFVLFSVYLLNGAFAINCYQCSSAADPECESNPQQEQFIFDCSKINSSNPKENPHATMMNYSSGFETNCFKAKIRNGEISITGRGCSPKSYDCDSLRATLPAFIKIDFCEICETDLCNK